MAEQAQTKKQELQTTNTAPMDLVVRDDSEFANYLDTARFNQAWRNAVSFSRAGEMVPKHFQGNPDACMVAIQMAFRLGIDPLMALQKTYVVSGKPGLESSLVIALLNRSKALHGRLKWRFDGEGDKMRCTAYAIDAETGEQLELSIDWKTVVAEGWYGKPGSKWKTMPEQMFRYRTAAWFARAYFPEVLMGLHTVDELRDMPIDLSETEPGVYAQDPYDKEPKTQTDKVKSMLKKRKPEPKPEAEPKQEQQPATEPEQPEPKSDGIAKFYAKAAKSGIDEKAVTQWFTAIKNAHDEEQQEISVKESFYVDGEWSKDAWNMWVEQMTGRPKQQSIIKE